MAYEPVIFPPVSQQLSAVLAQMNNQFADIRELMIARGPAGGLSIATLLFVLTDSAANLFQPSEKDPADRFKAFLRDNYPWDEDQPYGLQPENVIDLLWEVARTPAVHRMGLQPDPIFNVGYVLLHQSDDDGLRELELSAARPYSEPSVKFDGTTLKILLESHYWGLRKAVWNAVSTKPKVDAIVAHIKAGDFARTNGLFKLLKADVPRPKKPGPKPKS